MRRRRSLLAPFVGAALVIAFFPALVAAQRASLLADINTTWAEDNYGPNSFWDLRAAGGKLFFGGGDNVGGELWVSDGTSAGTEVLRDTCPGRCGGDITPLGSLGSTMLVSIGPELWRSDGTRPGTFALTEPGLIVDVATPLPRVVHAPFHGAYYFVGCTYDSGGRSCDLWRTDGSVAGTGSFHQLGGSSFYWLQVAGERLYYLASDDVGSDLWVTDGTEAGTVQLHHFQGGHDSAVAPTAAGSRLFFQATDSFPATGNGREVWTSDGTVAGTRSLTDLAPADPFGYADWLLPAGSRVYFAADDGAHGREIWRTDGTEAGTVRVTDLAVERPFSDDQPSFLAEVNGILVFEASDAESPSPLWTSRGTPGSTAPLAIPCSGCELAYRSPLVASGGRAFFVTENNYETALWATDGTAAGTRELGPSCYACSDETMRAWRDGLLIALEHQLWFSDGTPAGTKLFAQLPDSESFSYGFELAALGDDVYFFAWGEEGLGLWVRDAAGKTRPIYTPVDEVPTSVPARLTAFDDRLLFTAWDGQTFSANDLWSSEGTAETTHPLAVSGIDWNWDTTLVPAAGILFFQTGEAYEPHNLWRTDGTAAGTFVVAHLQAKAVMVPYQGALYFFDGGWIWKTDGTVDGTDKAGELPPELLEIEVATAGANGIYMKGVTAAPFGTEFWFTDGTGAGTRQITHLNLNGVRGSDPELTRFGDHVYFSWDGIWRSDGTLAGTMPIPLPGLAQWGYATKLVVHDGWLYFFTAASTSAVDLVLWRTNGTTTVELARFPGQDTYYFPVKLTPFGGKLYFNVDDGVHGIELWVTDGTAAGTRLVSDLYPGWRSSSPTQLTPAGDRFYFSAGDDLHGVELWQSDGTAASTRLVQDIAPQAESSSPQQLTVAGDNLYFTADDGATGREVWVLPLAGSGACSPSATRLCLNGGRYAVEATWLDFAGRRGVGHAVSLTADTGYFWFFDSSNVEAILKVLDGRGLNDHVWVFYGALSSVEYTLTVTDTQTGVARRYRNLSGQLASVGDTSAFGPRGASLRAGTTTARSPSPGAIVERRTATTTEPCAPSPTRLCLGSGRFAVEIAWQDFAGNTGSGQARTLTGDTGAFWFFGPENIEVVLKVLDGRPVNGRHWVFYGALSNVRYTVTVTDTQTGRVNVYTNPSGRFASIADVDAF